MKREIVTLLLPGFTQGQDDIAVQAHPCHKAFRFNHEALQQPWQSQLAHALGVDTCEGKRLPVAGLDNASAENGLVRADPISLKADRDTARLVPAQQLGLSETEADELLLALNQFVAEDGFRFFRRGAGEWYMSGMAADHLACYPPSFLAERNASAFLPEGDSAAPWRRLLTEIQMLLHGQPVNQLREQRGMLPVNSVWFWGAAPLAIRQPDNANTMLYADNAEAIALARLIGVATQPLTAFAPDSGDPEQAGHIIVFDDTIFNAWLRKDIDELGGAMAQINENLLQPLVKQVKSGQLPEVQIFTEDGLHGVCDEPLSWWGRTRARFNR